MTTVLIGWELGAGLGHVMRAAAFSSGFAAAGAKVVVAAPDLADITRVRWPRDIRIVPAPQPRRVPSGFFDPSTYAELLYSCGYHDANQVGGLVTAWFNLMEMAKADIVVLDHAPAAHLAAGVQGIPHVRVGTGFFAPPVTAPLPCFRDWHAADPSRALDIEAHVLGVVNRTLEACGAPAAPSLGSALEPTLELIASPPEFDCYAMQRSSASTVYLGCESIEGQGASPQWPGAEGSGRKRVTAYLKADYGATPLILAALKEDVLGVAYVGGLGAADRERLQSHTLWISPDPLDLGMAARAADALICHAGAGSAPAFLAAGKPVLLLPYSAEQRVNASLIAATGAGAWLAPDESAASFRIRLADLLGRPDFTRAAEQLASRWRGRPDAVQLGVERTLKILEEADPT